MQTQKPGRTSSDLHIAFLREVNNVPEGWFSKAGAAAYLNMSESGIWHASHKGLLASQKFGTLTCYSKEALDAYDTHRRVRTKASEPETEKESGDVKLPENWEDAFVDIVPESVEASDVPGEMPPPHDHASDNGRKATQSPYSNQEKLVSLSHGSIYLCYDLNLFEISEAERTLLFTLIDAIKQYERMKGVL